MVHFESFEKLGVAVAAMSDLSDGDCGLRRDNAARSNRGRFCLGCGVDPEEVLCAQQVHGAAVRVVKESDPARGGTPFPSTDGLLTAAHALPLAVFVADCVPIYLFDPERRAGGIIHAGREGTLRNISGQAVSVLQRELGARAGNLHVVLGPSAGPCCYQVSSQMATAWTQAGLPARGRNLDLWEANTKQLVQAGIPSERITVVGACTICSGHYHSYRRDATTARNMALLMI